MYQAHNATWRCDMHATRFTLVWLSHWFDWQPALTIVHPATFKRWRRQGWRLLLTKPAKPGRPPIPPALQVLIRRMARENVTWGQQRIANELLLKLGLRVSPRTVRKYLPRDCGGGPGPRCPSQRWSTFIRNHAHGLIVSGLVAVLTHSVQAWSDGSVDSCCGGGVVSPRARRMGGCRRTPCPCPCCTRQCQSPQPALQTPRR
jgi:hypothetical protein